MKVVIDTNVLVSGLLSPYGAAAEIVRMLVAGSIDILYDARIISEYEEVLSRPRFAFKKTHIEYLIDYIRYFGIPISAKPMKKYLRDPDDEAFLEIAISGEADCLITGNLAHYPIRRRAKPQILTPRQFLTRYF